MSIYRRYGKRTLDLTVAALCVLLLLPFLLIVALLVKLDSPGPAFSVQERLGFRGRTFRLLKFRTMTHKARTVEREILPGDPEVTRLGAFLRRFKIDETPQILNVLRGDMSLVGPRPVMPEQAAEYDAVSRRRLEVRPGLTGAAQVHGNIYLDLPDRWRYDVAYVDSLSFWQDLRLIGKTVLVLLAGEKRFMQRPNPSSAP